MVYNSVLCIIDIKKIYIEEEILSGISFEFNTQKTYIIHGESGSGKSTLFHILAGIDQPTVGSVLYDSIDVRMLASNQRASFASLVLQNAYLIKELTVLENILLAGMIASCDSISYAKQLEYALFLLNRVGLSSYESRFVGRLSGGQQQRVALARALMLRPRFLIGDEITGNLDTKTSLEIMDLMRGLQYEYGMGLVISSHVLHIHKSTDIVFVLKNGILVPVDACFEKL